jgi:hypothetical protein
MPRAVRGQPLVITFTSQAPTKIAGQTRKPKNSVAASAMPVGGHTGLALAWMDAK